jgi:methionyl-tRNA synthetase
MNKQIFITTTLPYINSSPHVGHLFEFVIGDAISRYLRCKNGHDSVIFNTGLDEHGLKIWQKSQELGIPIEKYIDEYRNSWIRFCELFKISYNIFYNTATNSHKEFVQKFWNINLKNGDIYKKSYNGRYCVGCESFKLDKDLVNNSCIEHSNLEIQEVSEENYFFKSSKYKSILREWINNGSNFLSPSWRLDEINNLLDTFGDISISRLKKNVPWGISVPNDDDHVIYVWYDALLSYLSSAGYFTDEFKWGNVLQICGPDNIKHQSIIFQTFLESQDIEKTNRLLVHGTILDKDGRKMSKTVGNVIDPIDQLNKYGLNAIRYYTLAGLSTTGNAAWSEDDLVNLYNSHLCDEWGNLVSRVIHLCNLKDIKILENACNADAKFLIGEKVESIHKLWESLNIKEALTETNAIVKWVNGYLNDTKPWIDGNIEVLNTAYWIISEVNKLYHPILPETSSDIDFCLENREKRIYFERIKK